MAGNSAVYDFSFIMRAVDGVTGPFKTIKTSIEGMSTSITQFGERINQSMTGFQRIFEIGDRISAMGDKVAAFGNEFINAAKGIEVTETSLKAMMGDAEDAEKLFKNIDKVAQEFGIPDEQLYSISRKLIEVGFDADKITKTMHGLADAAFGANVPLESLVDVYANVINSGVIGNREVRALRSYKGFWEGLAQSLGVTKDVAKEMVKSGKLGALDFQNYIVTVSTGAGKLAGQAKIQSMTLDGIMRRFGEVYHAFKVGVGQAVIDALGLKEKWEDKIEMLKSITAWLTEFIKNHPMLTKIIIYLLALVTVLGPLIIGLGMLAVALEVLAGALLKTTAEGMPIFVIVLLIAAGIIALIAVVNELSESSWNVMDAWRNASTEMKVAMFIILGPILLIAWAIEKVIAGLEYMGWKTKSIKAEAGEGILSSLKNKMSFGLEGLMGGDNLSMEQLTKKLKIANTSESTVNIKVKSEKGTFSMFDGIQNKGPARNYVELDNAEPK